MPTKTILIDELLEKQIDSPVDWSMGLFPFYGWYDSVETIQHESDTIITKVTLNLRVKAYYFNGVSEYGNVFYKVKFNDTEIIDDYLWTGNTREYTIDVTEQYRKLSGSVPQVLTIGIASVPAGQHSHLITTAYLEIEYSGTAPEPAGSGFDKETSLNEILGIMVSFMFTTFMMSMMVGMMTAMLEV